jgi:hypothetical protein
MFIDLQSSFIGPIPTGSHWLVQLFADADQLNPVSSALITFQSNPQRIQWNFGQVPLSVANFSVLVGQTVFVKVSLENPSFVVLDSTTTSFPWAQSSADYIALIQQIPAAGSGLTATQATQLAEAHSATQVVVTTPTGETTVPLSDLLSLPTLDSLTLTEVTTGPTPDFASVELPNSAVGVIVRITTIGGGYAATSPDDGYFVPELAVARFFRGSDLVERIGIHTVSRFIYPIPGAWAYWTTTLFGGDLPPDMSVQVNFAAGNLGELFYTKLPWRELEEVVVGPGVLAFLISSEQNRETERWHL